MTDEVTIEQRDKCWIVTVAEGNPVYQEAFHVLQHAQSWAAGQTARLQQQLTRAPKVLGDEPAP